VKTVAAIAWRNLWRNRRRTLLTAGGIAFAVTLLSFAMAQQIGSYALMIDNATALLTSHIQVQRDGYRDDPRIEKTVPRVSETLAEIDAMAGVRGAAPRLIAFVLVSSGERSVAAQLMGVDAARERELSTLPSLVADGRYLDGAAGDVVDAYAGAALARNLGVVPGDEIVMLGTDASGGVAPLVARLAGTFATGQAELDRSVLQVPIDAMRSAFSFGDEAHAILVRAEDVAGSRGLAVALRGVVCADCVVLEWPALIPELQQTIDLDRVSNRLFYGLLALLVSFTVVNSFVMVLFERTREFGMLLAIGMRPGGIVGMLLLEGVWLAVLGIALGLALAVPVVAWVAEVGLPLGEAGGEMLRRFHMPDRMYTALDVDAFVPPSLIMLFATILAALLPSLRVRRLRPVEALRAD
jgi:ABC-type lipoprotein release transport system permease subunit